ncbi:MAG: hypothetical protein JWM76_4706 [Pseudonocardiales bacterium]|nr:hypothetical protein [Pseudonocardiales bacterium]
MIALGPIVLSRIECSSSKIGEVVPAQMFGGHCGVHYATVRPL